MEDPCIQCDKRDQHDSFLEQNQPQINAPKEPAESSLLRRALEQYQQDHLKYKHLIENAPDAIIVADTETELILEASCKTADLLGIPTDQIIGKHISKLHPPEETEKYTELFRKHAQMDSLHTLEEVELCSSDGKKKPLQIALSTAQLGDRKLMYGFFRDMTEQKELLEQLETSEQELKAVFESSPDSIIIVDQNYTNLYINQSALDQINVTPEQGGIGKTIRDSLGHIPDFMHLWMGRIDEVFKTGEPMRVTDAVPIDDRIVHSESVLSPIRYPNGEMFAVGVLYRNVTELRTSEERFKRLSEATFEGICSHDNGLILDANQQFSDMFGYSLDEIKGLDCFTLVAPQSHAKVKECIETGNERPYEAFSQRKDGSIFPTEVRVKEYQQDGKTLRMAAFRDLTCQKEMQRQLANSEQKYKDLYHNAKAALFRTRLSDGTLLDCSRITVALLGYTNKEEYQNQFSVTESYVDPQRREQFIEALQKDKRVQGFGAQLKRKDGTAIWVSLTAEVFPEQDYIEGVMVDITATKILTKTEMNILREIIAGKSNKRIAYGLKRSTRTIEDHRAHIMHKLGVDNIVDLTRKALQYGITPNSE